MCTATLLPPTAACTTRLVINRDELHTRAEASPPVERAFGEHSALLPIDPDRGGTWVGVNDLGLVLTLLNLNPLKAIPQPRRARPLRSRGGIIPSLLHLATAAEVADYMLSHDPLSTRPFTLLVTDANDLVSVCCDGREMRPHISTRPSAPLMQTSSGLGDHIIAPARRELGEQWFGDDPTTWPDQQDALHRHHWDDRPHLSILMHREDARTVSITTVEVTPDAVTTRYEPIEVLIDSRDATRPLGLPGMRRVPAIKTMTLDIAAGARG